MKKNLNKIAQKKLINIKIKKLNWNQIEQNKAKERGNKIINKKSYTNEKWNQVRQRENLIKLTLNIWK